MKDSIRLGRLAGVSVGLNWSLVVMVVIVASGLADNRFPIDASGYGGGAYAVAGIAAAGVLLFGVLLHELGHAIVARRVGLRVDGITLSWMGGVTRIEGEAPRPSAELVVAAVGPFVSAAFGGVLWLIRLAVEGAGGGRLLIAALGWLAVINVVLAGFNLLPASPLDGGRVLHALVWGVARDRWRATRVAAATGMGLGALVIVGGFALLSRTSGSIDGLFVSLIGWWIVGSARAELNVAAVHHALEGVRLSDIMRPVGAAPGWITVRAFVEGYSSGRPGWVWLLESWGGGYGGVVLGDSVGAVPLPQWDLARPLDIAVPISATTGADPGDDALSALVKTGEKQLILVVDGGHTVGAVLPSDVEALVRMRAKGPVASRGWSLTRG